MYYNVLNLHYYMIELRKCVFYHVCGRIPVPQGELMSMFAQLVRSDLNVESADIPENLQVSRNSNPTSN